MAENLSYILGGNRTGSFDALSVIMRKYKPLSPDDEIELIYQYRAGGEASNAAKDALILHNIAFVCSRAKRKTFDAERILDLVGAGIFGLIRAIDSFDATRGTKLITYAVNYIDEYMNLYITDAQLIKRSNYMKFGYRIPKAENDFILKNGREPSTEELAEVIERESGSKICDLSDITAISISSTNDDVVDDDSTMMLERSDFALMTATKNDYEEKMDKEDASFRVGKLLETITPRSRDIVRKVYGIGEDREFSLDEIADEYGMSVTRVRQILKEAENKMKSNRRYLFAE